MKSSIFKKVSFCLVLAIVLSMGLTTGSAAEASSSCPASACSSLSNHSYIGSCVRDLGHCLGFCATYRHNNSGATCYNGCNWA